MRLQLLDRTDINRYGKSVADVPDHIAENLIRLGRAKSLDSIAPPLNSKVLGGPPAHKMVWTPPEAKAMQSMEKSIVEQPIAKYPDATDPLFPLNVIN